MQRRALKNTISKYAKNVKFYRYGLISKYLKHLEKEENELLNSIPTVVCPHCNSKHIEIEYSDSEYSCESYLCCEHCGEAFEDKYEYIDVVESIRDLAWNDSILIRAHFEDDVIDFSSIKWKQYCEEEILKTINNQK